jgi:TonB family protein
MSDKKNKMEDFLTGYFRYRKNELTPAERNAFERELQKDPFSEEAAEGLSSIAPEEASEDLHYLGKQIKIRSGRKQKLLFYRIAASVALLVAAGSLLLLLNRKDSGQIAINSNPTKEYEITSGQPIRKPDSKAAEKQEPEIAVQYQKSEGGIKTNNEALNERNRDSELTAVMEKRKADALTEPAVKLPDLKISEKAMAAPSAARAKSAADTRFTLKGRVISSEDKMPVPGANVVIRGTVSGAVTDPEGNFTIAVPDSGKKTIEINYIGMEKKTVDAKPEKSIDVILNPSMEGLSEVVVTGYGIVHREQGEYDSVSGHTPPSPVNGKAAFNKFIQSNLHRPDSADNGKKMVVVLNFKVRRDGSIDSIVVIRSPGENYSDEAIRVLKSGPEWKPAEENGVKVDDDVRLRIVFR